MIVEVENYKTEHAGQQRVVSQMDSVQASARDVLSELRQLVYELRGEEAVGGCFVDVVGSLLARYKEHTGIDTELTVRGGWPAKLRTPAASNLRSLIEEALANARRHSGARSVSVVLESAPSDRLAITVSDNGRGLESVPYRVAGLGLTGMGERALLLGGRLLVEGVAGQGTTVRASFPRALLANEGGIG
jgi:two-component system sensor histidine kinase UhpB